MNTLPAGAFTADPTGTDLAVAARFLDTSDDVPGFFRTLLPDSGIVPVRVALRNDGAGRFVIHSANGMELGPGFEGVALGIEGKKYFPIHPKRIAEILVGVKKAARYRRVDAFQFVAGTMIAPLGAYYIYGEIDVGKYYRPLFKSSFYPALESGMFKPVRLGPGEEKSGYLYFAVPKIREGASCELLVNACAPIDVRDTLAGYDFKFARDEMPLEAGVDSSAQETMPLICRDSPYGYLFKLAKEGDSGKKGLYACTVDRLTPDPHAPWAPIASILSKSAVIADAPCRGSIAVCAVNFKSKSKVFIVQCGDGVKGVAERSFFRNVKRAFVTDRGVFVLTEDNFCHFLEHPSLTPGRSVRLGQDIEDAALVDTSLFVFSRGRRLDLFGTAGGALFAPLDQRPLGRGARTVIGLLNDELVVLNRGSHAREDTLAVFNIERRAEIRRGVLAGKIGPASTGGSGLVVQLEDGTLLRIVPAPLGKFKIAEAGYLPFMARELKAVPRGFIALDESGACAAGAVCDYGPGTNGALEVSVKVR